VLITSLQIYTLRIFWGSFQEPATFPLPFFYWEKVSSSNFFYWPFEYLFLDEGLLSIRFIIS
jgi:hypothetical protein